MKKRFLICYVLLLVMGTGTVWAQERKLPEPGGGAVAVLDKATFVEVRDRGPGYHSVILYEVVKGKIRIVDAVKVNSDFTKDPTLIRYKHINDIKEQ